VFRTFVLNGVSSDPDSECDRKYTCLETCGKLCELTRVPFDVTNRLNAFHGQMDRLVAEKGFVATFPNLDHITVGGHTRKEHDEDVKRALEENRFTDQHLMLLRDKGDGQSRAGANPPRTFKGGRFQ